MNKIKVYLSFDVNNNKIEKIFFISQSIHSTSAISIKETSVNKNSVHNWKEFVESKIEDSELLIVLVGKKTAYSKSVAEEIYIAKKKKIPFFGVYVGGATINDSLPTGLEINYMTNWEWNEIGTFISILMKESLKVG
jgi:hypothetical protein